jgi:hypothetical protein
MTIKLEQRLGDKPANHLSSRDQYSQPMPGREEGLGLFRGHPLIRAMLVTQSHARCTGDRAAIIYTNDFILGARVTAIEMRRPEAELDVHVQTQLFEGFPPHRLHKALTLLKSTGDTLPLPGSKVLCCRPLKQEVLAIRLPPDEHSNHCEKSAYSHQSPRMCSTAELASECAAL